MRFAIPFIGPMKSVLLKTVNLEKRRRNGVALLFCVCLTLFAFTAAAAQVKDNKHITAIQLGAATEGSRVTVVSDSPLIDYEAFRRGNRFYVKIPLADLSAAAPHFRADGFEDVQVQKVGDSQIVSFKLQPGATARVDQRGNRLDVIFSAANRIPLNTDNPPGDLGPDAAGPMPSDSAASRVRTAKTNKADDNHLTTANLATASASPSSSPSSILSPATSTPYQPLSATTPIAQSTSSPTNSSSDSTGSLNWRSRLAAAWLWMSLGAMILLSLIVLLVFVRRRRQESAVKTAVAPARRTIVSPAAGHFEQREEGEREVIEL